MANRVVIASNTCVTKEEQGNGNPYAGSNPALLTITRKKREEEMVYLMLPLSLLALAFILNGFPKINIGSKCRCNKHKCNRDE